MCRNAHPLFLFVAPQRAQSCTEYYIIFLKDYAGINSFVNDLLITFEDKVVDDYEDNEVNNTIKFK